MTTASHNADLPTDLADLRARLDTVDTGIHRLLRERFEIVEAIGASKGPVDAIIRPAREAAVIENRLALHKGAMPPEMLAHIWRVLISAACTIQRPFKVHTCGALDAALFLYGAISATTHATPDAAVMALRDGDVAVLAEEGAWWNALGDGAAHVIGRVRTSVGPSCVIVGGAGVSRGTGPEAVVLRGGVAQFMAANDVSGDDELLGRFHPFPIPVPVSEASSE
ncbi:MAG: chorismate mutase [Pseudomonadota bacterium]